MTFWNTKAEIFIYSKEIDMRWGFERLSYIIRERMGKDINYGDLFLFLGFNRKRLKALTFDGSGLILMSKRLEKKNFMLVSDLISHKITRQELKFLVHGSVLRKYFPDKKILRKK